MIIRRFFIASLMSTAVTLAVAMPAQAAPQEGEGDYVHVTNFEASAHAWWGETTTSGVGTTAKVELCLQAYAPGVGWRTKACETRNLLAGGDKTTNKNYRINTRHPCGPQQGPYAWRSRIDVDILYQPDPSGYVYTATRYLNCGY